MAKIIVPMDEIASTQASLVPEQQHHLQPGGYGHTDGHDEQHHRMRSMSLSLSWRRPKSGTFVRVDALNLPRQAHDHAIDDSEDAHEPFARRLRGRGRAHSAASAFRGAIRRASLSLRGLVHRRLSATAEATGHDRSRTSRSRPTTSHGSLDRHYPEADSHLDIRPVGEEQTGVPIDFIIPLGGGAAAKASLASQNKSFRQPIPSSWLYAGDENNDRESGIGIVVTEPLSESEAINGVPVPQDSSISRVDFITKLPVELAIHVLACLDAAALAKASTVCKSWKRVVANQHIWRESCLRETTATYATGGPIEPGSGLGVPNVAPGNDWKEIYRVKLELNQRWKEGMSRPVYLNGHSDSIYCLQFDEYKIISGSRDKTIRIWDMHTLECSLIIGPPEVVYGPTILEDGEGNPTHYATHSNNQKTAMSTPNVVSYPEHHKASILCLQYDEEILVTGSSDFTCLVYDMKDRYRPIRRLRHHTAAVLDLTFDKKHIVTCSKDISICVWDRETGTLLRQLRGHTGPVNAVQMRGNTIVSCSGDFRVKLWNIDTGKNIREFVGHTKGLACSQFSEDGRYVASAGNDKVIRIWDANTGECVREMKAHDNLVRSLHIDSVSGRLISGSYDTDIKVWDMETGHQLLDFPRWHASWVLSAKSDYRRIVSTGQDPKILIMDFGADVKGIEMLASGRPGGVGSTGEFI